MSYPPESIPGYDDWKLQPSPCGDDDQLSWWEKRELRRERLADEREDQ